jgi:hypothetical protein
MNMQIDTYPFALVKGVCIMEGPAGKKREQADSLLLRQFSKGSSGSVNTSFCFKQMLHSMKAYSSCKAKIRAVSSGPVFWSQYSGVTCYTTGKVARKLYLWEVTNLGFQVNDFDITHIAMYYIEIPLS